MICIMYGQYMLWRIYLSKLYHIITISLFSLTGIMGNKGNHPKMARHFSLVNYCRVPRYMDNLWIMYGESWLMDIWITYGNIWLIEGSLEVKLPTIWTDEKQSRAEAERRERLEERRSEKRKSQKKEDADARKGRKVAKHCFSNDLWLRRVEK